MKILARAEQIIKTDIRYLLKGGFWLGLGQVLTTITGLVLSIALANLLPKEVYGSYKYILSLITIFSIFTLSGMDAAVTQAVARGYDDAVMAGFKEKMRWGFLGLICVVAMALYYLHGGNELLAYSLLAVAAFLPFTEALDIFNSLLNGRKLFAEYTRLNVFRQVAVVIISLVTLLLTHNYFFLVLAYCAGHTVVRGLAFIYVMRKVPRKHDSSQNKSAITYGRHLSFMDIIGTILGQLDDVLVFHYLGAASLAVYTLAIAPADQIKGMLKNVNTLALPKFATSEKNETRKFLFHKMLWLALFIAGVVLVYIIFAPLFFSVFFPHYMASVPYSQVLAVSIIPASLSMFLYTFLESHAETKAMYHFNIWSNVINLAILFAMIYFFGLWGAIIARIVIRIFLLLLSIVLVRRV
jgi:O-antigen/teichoic acid export membrane protein